MMPQYNAGDYVDALIDRHIDELASMMPRYNAGDYAEREELARIRAELQ